ncbi:MAG TPA: adenosylcobinamide-phosphate synthase CbiB [Methyloceanibacter sp.]|nr:adenosylcobinamide-phosphate synthase CbiB [Methyloceanibacter sp.]
MAAPLTLLALLIEVMVGYPDGLARSIGHPVTWMGRLIDWLDRRLNRDDADPETRRRAGAVALLLLLGVVGLVAFFIERSLLLLPLGFIAVAILASTFIAQRSLFIHIARVAEALDEGGVAAGREAVAQVVGRDTADLDEAGVARAAIESLAENFSDGVVAPAFWMVIAGLPGAALYKAINTADSMIGHRTKRHQDFGRTAAQLDDIVNFPASRLSSLLIVAASYLTKGASASGAWQATWRDGSKHASPNAGYPEAAMAGALGLSLAGPRVYDGASTDGAWMGDGRREAKAADIRAALELYGRADGLLIAIVFVLAVLIAIG